MANALPLIFIAGAAVYIFSQKKKDKGGSSGATSPSERLTDCSVEDSGSFIGPISNTKIWWWIVEPGNGGWGIYYRADGHDDWSDTKLFFENRNAACLGLKEWAKGQ